MAILGRSSDDGEVAGAEDGNVPGIEVELLPASALKSGTTAPSR